MTTSEILASISLHEWVRRWAGSYTFISCTYWARQYDRALTARLGVGFKTNLFIHRKGVVTFLLRRANLDAFGREMAARTTKDNGFGRPLLEELKGNADALSRVMGNLAGRIPTLREYDAFLALFERHLPLHNYMKKTPDYLDARTLKNLLPLFLDARVYSEPVYSSTEHFFRNLAQAIASRERYGKDFLTCLTQDEIEEYLKTRKLPVKNILKARWRASAIYYARGKMHILTGGDTRRVEKAAVPRATAGLQGVGAHPGIARGACRIILDPHKPSVFNKGDILVTGMTRPEFLPYIEKAGGLVTDVGGVLCHAAITAREFKIPCVVGTQNATKLLKNGQTIVVDGKEGTVRREKMQNFR